MYTSDVVLEGSPPAEKNEPWVKASIDTRETITSYNAMRLKRSTSYGFNVAHGRKKCKKKVYQPHMYTR